MIHRVIRLFTKSSLSLLIWPMVGLTLWIFLAFPYTTAAVGCISQDTTDDCLKLLAQNLRNDSTLATYAAATVAAAIAFQLSSHNREPHPADDPISSN